MGHPATRYLLFVIIVTLMPSISTQAAEEEFDSARWKLQVNAWISAPTGYFNGRHGEGYFDLQRDFGFGNYATSSGRLDWRFKRKHHLLFTVTPVNSSRSTTLSRTINWQDDTFDVGIRTNASVKSLLFTPGYQYDFFRFRQGSLGFLVNVNLAYTSATLKASAGVSSSGSTVSASTSASGSLFAPLPAIGPTFRWYLVPNSSRLYLDGTLSGMSFFGYGNFGSGNGVLGFPLGRHWDAHAGYLLGSRLKITGSSDNIAIRLTQKGPIFGIEYHWDLR